MIDIIAFDADDTLWHNEPLFLDTKSRFQKLLTTYHSPEAKHGVEPGGFLMIGDSLRSDILPVLEIGGHAIHVPYDTTWRHEDVPAEVMSRYSFQRAGGLGEVPALVAALG
jgi:putative hydrolase of the HAD superfamily